MATAISLTNFQTACGNCYDSINSEDWSAAKKYYAMAEAQLAGLALRLSDRERTIMRRESLEPLKKAIDAAEIATNKSDGSYRTIKARTGFGS